MADLVGIQNRFRGEWLGPAAEPGLGRLRWLVEGLAPAQSPLLEVRDKGRLPYGQPVTWVIPGDGITVQARAAGPDAFAAQVVDARYLGEITLATLALDRLPGVQLRLMLSGPQRRGVQSGSRLSVHLDTALIHVMPLRTRPGIAA